jgi:hypothetical protein
VKLVRFVDDDEISIRPLAPSDRLNAANLDRLFTIGPRVTGLHDANGVNAFSPERGDGLVDQGLARERRRRRAFPWRARA